MTTTDATDAAVILRQVADLIDKNVAADQPAGEAAECSKQLRDAADAVVKGTKVSPDEVDAAESYGSREWAVSLARALYGHKRAATLFPQQP